MSVKSGSVPHRQYPDVTHRRFSLPNQNKVSLDLTTTRKPRDSRAGSRLFYWQSIYHSTPRGLPIHTSIYKVRPVEQGRAGQGRAEHILSFVTQTHHYRTWLTTVSYSESNHRIHTSALVARCFCEQHTHKIIGSTLVDHIHTPPVAHTSLLSHLSLVANNAALKTQKTATNMP